MDEYLIYPKQFQRVSIPVEKNRCFVIMPFKEELDLVYGTIKRGLNNAGYICNRVDEILGSTPIINKILTEILRSRYIIADLQRLTKGNIKTTTKWTVNLTKNAARLHKRAAFLRDRERRKTYPRAELK